MVKNLPAVQETWVQSLSQEDPLEKEMATHFSILAWEMPWTQEPAPFCSTWGWQRVRLRTHTQIHIRLDIYKCLKIFQH